MSLAALFAAPTAAVHFVLLAPVRLAALFAANAAVHMRMAVPNVIQFFAVPHAIQSSPILLTWVAWLSPSALGSVMAAPRPC
eukprot:1421451-Karenia_brevis.AAC.1